MGNKSNNEAMSRSDGSEVTFLLMSHLVREGCDQVGHQGTGNDIRGFFQVGLERGVEGWGGEGVAERRGSALVTDKGC